MIQPLLAHGIGERADLPIPVSLAQYSAVFVLVATFVLIGRSSKWRTARFEAGGRPVPRLQRVVDSRVTSVLLRTLGFLLLAVTLTVAVLGENNPGLNPVPTWLYVWLWVGLVPASIVFGSIWRRIDPLPVIASVLRKVVDDDETDISRYPTKWGLWPAAIGLLVFTWLELVMPDSDLPRTIAIFLFAYALIQIALGTIYGPSWFKHAAIFSTYSAFIAHLSPWQRDAKGRLIFANPFRNLAALPNLPGTLAVVSVLLGSTAFDGFTRTDTWTTLSTDASDFTLLAAGTAALVAATFLVGLTFRFAISASSGNSSVASRFAHSLIPIAVGYSVAHYFSLFLFQGQAGYLLANDPLDNGADFFGLVGDSINYLLVSTEVIAVVQVAAIVLGHVVGVVAAHDRALVSFGEGRQIRSQYPLMTMMAVYTFVGIGLLLGA